MQMNKLAILLSCLAIGLWGKSTQLLLLFLVSHMRNKPVNLRVKEIIDHHYFPGLNDWAFQKVPTK